MTKKILVSIIIPTLNEEKFLVNTLNYLQHELEGFPFEIVISDGGSKDGTLVLAKKHGAKIFCKKEGNKSIAEARNLGVKVAAGDYFLFMDADVKITRLRQFMEKSMILFKKSDIAAITVKADINLSEKKWQDWLGYAVLNFMIMLANLLGLGAAIGEVQFIRRTDFEKAGGYNEELVTSEDVDMFKRLSRFKKTLYLNEFTGFYSRRRINKEGWMRILGRFCLNFIWYSLFKRSYIKKWPAIR